MYKVIKQFRDRDYQLYKIGDEFHSDDEKHLELLSTEKNRYRMPFIEKVVEEKKPRTRKKKVVEVDGE